jgi:hypothetical protein
MLTPIVPSLSLTAWLALWGAFTGSVLWIIGIYNFIVDRPRLKIDLSKFTEEQAREIDVNLVIGAGRQYIVVEIVNAGRRKVTVYHPELWVVNELGLLQYESPDKVLHDEQWTDVNNHWKLYALTEGDTLTFIFRLANADCIARIDLADTLGRFRYRQNVVGAFRWWRAKLTAVIRAKTWRSLRDAFSANQRPRHHNRD